MKKPALMNKLLQLSLTVALALTAPAWAADTAAPTCGDSWPAWAQFRTQFVAQDGRVIDPETPRSHTVSEAQAYGLFFALVANDRPSFELILKWTEANMAKGDLTARLAAWQWGKRDDGSWGTVDENSATDADLWMIYALGEAGRLWKDKRFTALSFALSERLLKEVTQDFPGLGLTLLPGPKGFKVSDTQWRLNPSYYPIHQMRWLAKREPKSGWAKVMQSSQKIVQGAVPKGFAPDWIVFNTNATFDLDTQTEGRGMGGYDAIRVYLWAGLLNPKDPLATPLLKAMEPMAKAVEKNGHPQEFIYVLTGEGPKVGPSGFSAALLPFLQARGDKAALQSQLQRLEAKPIRPKAYYEQALNLFGRGGYEGVFRFEADGGVQVKWKAGCGK